MLQCLCCAGDPPPSPLRRRGRSRLCWSSEKSELHYEILMNNRADFSVYNNDQKLQIASPLPRQARCKLRLRETLMVKALSPRRIGCRDLFCSKRETGADNGNSYRVHDPPPDPLQGGGNLQGKMLKQTFPSQLSLSFTGLSGMTIPILWL